VEFRLGRLFAVPDDLVAKPPPEDGTERLAISNAERCIRRSEARDLFVMIH
jgi:hypothetical protein